MKLVLIDWIDSGTVDRWRQLEEIASDNEPLRCRSIGWLVAESKEAITLAGSIAGERGRLAHQGCGTICIPKKAIRKRRVLA